MHGAAMVEDLKESTKQRIKRAQWRWKWNSF